MFQWSVSIPSSHVKWRASMSAPETTRPLLASAVHWCAGGGAGCRAIQAPHYPINPAAATYRTTCHVAIFHLDSIAAPAVGTARSQGQINSEPITGNSSGWPGRRQPVRRACPPAPRFVRLPARLELRGTTPCHHLDSAQFDLIVKGRVGSK